MEFLANNMGLLAGGGASAIVLFILKKIPNESIYETVESACYYAGKREQYNKHRQQASPATSE